MDFNVKLQQLRTKKGLTQEQLAEKVCVSRVAVSKWESGRGYPNLDSLKMLAKVFEVSIDSLLSSEELLDIVEVHEKNKSKIFRTLVFGAIDFMSFLVFVIPLFANRIEGEIFTVTLQNLKLINPVIKPIFIVLVCMSGVFGAVEFAFQNIQNKWKQNLEIILSGLFSSLEILLSCMINQPYPCTYFFLLFLIKVVVSLRTL